MFSLICIWINGWVNNHEAGALRRHRGQYDVNVMKRTVLLDDDDDDDYGNGDYDDAVVVVNDDADDYDNHDGNGDYDDDDVVDLDDDGVDECDNDDSNDGGNDDNDNPHNQEPPVFIKLVIIRLILKSTTAQDMYKESINTWNNSPCFCLFHSATILAKSRSNGIGV